MNASVRVMALDHDAAEALGSFNKHLIMNSIVEVKSIMFHASCFRLLLGTAVTT